VLHDAHPNKRIGLGMSNFFRGLLIPAALALAGLLAPPAEAQRGPRSGEMFGGPPQQDNVAGQFDYYALVLSWSPTHCATVPSSEFDPQCSRRDGRRYGFVLHGLWPQYERGFPDTCPTARRPYVPQPLIGNMLDIMPSPKLVIHEYRKHGTCSGLDASEYFALARKLYHRIRIPSDYVNPFENRMVGTEQLVDEFLAINPDVKPDMIAVVCGGPGNRLREVRICFNRTGELRPCGRNEDQRKLCSASRMFVPPVRATRLEPDQPGGGVQSKAPLPGPQVIPGVGR
jgi:ribonuclease T2